MSSIGGIGDGNRPDPEEIFQQFTDADGNLDVEALAKSLSERFGKTVGANDLLKRMDTDGSGTVSRDEFVAGANQGPGPHDRKLFDRDASPDPQSQFAEYQDENGNLDVDAFAKAMSERTGKEITADQIRSFLDKDGSGTVSADEFAAGQPPPPPDPSEVFNQFTDDQGNLDVDRFSQFISERTGQTVDPSQIRASLDLDGSGTITLDEFLAGQQDFQRQSPDTRGDATAGVGEDTDKVENQREKLNVLAQRVSKLTGKEVTAEQLMQSGANTSNRSSREEKQQTAERQFAASMRRYV
jgi:Ca2+-binding EF-hand superfamily protein